MQVAPDGQTVPHVPQLVVSVWRFTQRLLQSVVPVGHWQRPEEHTCVGGQSVPVPHAGPPGQMLAMVCPHVTVAGSVAGQRGAHTHMLFWQIWPAGHCVPVPGQVMPGHTLGMV